jgi:hypothetical protein
MNIKISTNAIVKISNYFYFVAIIILLLNSCESKTGRYGYIDKKGKLVIDSTYWKAESFSEGLAYVVDKFGDVFIDKTGKIVLKCENYIGNRNYRFSNGLALVQISDTSGYHLFYIDKKGKTIIDGKFNDANDFYEGLACICNTAEQTGYFYNKSTGEKQSDTYDFYYSFIDTTGKVIIKPEYKKAGNFSEGLAWVETNDHKFGYIDKTGKMIIESQRYFEVGNFSEGLAWVKLTDGKYAYIDKTGKIKLEPQEYFIVGNFSEGLAWIETNDNKYGYIDKTGKMIIEPKKYYSFEMNGVGDFHEGLAWVRKYEHGFGYIDKTGKMIIDVQFQDAKDFSEGRALVKF